VTRSFDNHVGRNIREAGKYPAKQKRNNRSHTLPTPLHAESEEIKEE
jgi:hypothetical protein